MRKRHGKYAVFLFAALMLSLAFSSCGSKKNKQQGYGGMEQTVSVATAGYSTVTLVQQYPATLVSNKQTNLLSEVGGRVEDILFKEGSHVSKGQPLYDIDKSVYQAAYNQAMAQLNAAQTNLATAQTDAQRYQNLLEHNAVDEIQVAHAKAQVKVYEADVNSAEAAVEQAKINLERATVVAPFSGSTNVSAARLGDLVIPNVTVLVTIADNSSMRADFHVPESQYVSMLAGKDGSDPALPEFKLVLPDGSMYSHNGKLDFVDSTVDPTTGTIMVRLIYPNPNEILKSGMNCVVKSEENTGKEYLVIPEQAVQQVLNEYHVYVVNDSGVVQDQKIELGQSASGKQIVTGGLKAGQKVIVEGIEKVRPQQRVKTTPYSGPEAPADTTRQSKTSGKR